MSITKIEKIKKILTNITLGVVLSSDELDIVLDTTHSNFTSEPAVPLELYLDNLWMRIDSNDLKTILMMEDYFKIDITYRNIKYVFRIPFESIERMKSESLNINTFLNTDEDFSKPKKITYNDEVSNVIDFHEAVTKLKRKKNADDQRTIFFKGK